MSVKPHKSVICLSSKSFLFSTLEISFSFYFHKIRIISILTVWKVIKHFICSGVNNSAVWIGETGISPAVLSVHLFYVQICVYVCVFIREFTMVRDCLGCLAFLLFNFLCGDYTNRKVIGLQALCHCLALSIKLTTISNPPIVHTEWLLSATVSWQWGENEHPLLFFSNLIMNNAKDTLHFFCFLPLTVFFSSSLCTQPCLFRAPDSSPPSSSL